MTGMAWGCAADPLLVGELASAFVPAKPRLGLLSHLPNDGINTGSTHQSALDHHHDKKAGHMAPVCRHACGGIVGMGLRGD